MSTREPVAHGAEPAQGMRHARMVLAAILAAGLALAVVFARDRPFTMDEYFTILGSVGQVPFGDDWATRRTIASGEVWAHDDPRGVLTALRADNGNMALYVLMLRGVIEAFGTGSATALAAPSIAGFLMTVWGTWRVGRRLFGDRVGLIASALCLCHYGIFVYGAYLRGYGWGMALGLLATERFLRIIGLGREVDGAAQSEGPIAHDVLPYAMWSVLALFAHFLTAVILVGHVLFAMATVRSRRTWARLIAAGALTTASFVPAYVLTLSSGGYGDVARYVGYREAVKGIPKRSPGEIARSVGEAVQMMSGLYSAWPLLLVLPACVLVVAAAVPQARRALAGDGRRLALAGALASISLAAASIRLAGSDSLFPMRARYSLMSAPYFVIVMARLLVAAAPVAGISPANLFRKAVVSAYAAVAASVPCVLAGVALTRDRGDASLEAARLIEQACRSARPCRVAVPTVFDAQMIAFRLGPARAVAFEITDAAAARQADEASARIGMRHSVVVYYEFQDFYQARGEAFRDLRFEGDTDGVLRFGYGKSRRRVID
jgi:hypothetical protein